MVAANSNDRIPFVGSNHVPPVNRLAERVRHYFDQYPEVAREEFVLESRREGTRTARPPLSAEDIRIHAWLIERLAIVHYERHGLWPKLRRFLFGNCLVRWLGLLRPRTGDE